MDEWHNAHSSGLHEIADCLIANVAGSLDEDGLIRLKKEILENLAATRLRNVLINVSAVSILGSYGISILLETARAAEMMGASTVFVGFRPGVAAALVEINADISGIQTAVTMADAFALLNHTEIDPADGLAGENPEGRKNKGGNLDDGSFL